MSEADVVKTGKIDSVAAINTAMDRLGLSNNSNKVKKEVTLDVKTKGVESVESLEKVIKSTASSADELKNKLDSLSTKNKQNNNNDYYMQEDKWLKKVSKAFETYKKNKEKYQNDSNGNNKRNLSNAETEMAKLLNSGKARKFDLSGIDSEFKKVAEARDKFLREDPSNPKWIYNTQETLESLFETMEKYSKESGVSLEQLSKNFQPIQQAAEKTSSTIKGMNDEANKSGKKNSDNGAKKQIEETGKAADDAAKKINELEIKLYNLRDAGKKQKKTDTRPKQEFVSTYAEYEKLANGQTKEIYSEYNKELIDNSKNLQKMYEDKKLAIEANEKLLSSEKQVADVQKQTSKTKTNTSTQEQTQQQEHLATASAKAGEAETEAQTRVQKEIEKTNKLLVEKENLLNSNNANISKSKKEENAIKQLEDTYSEFVNKSALSSQSTGSLSDVEDSSLVLRFKRAYEWCKKLGISEQELGKLSKGDLSRDYGFVNSDQNDGMLSVENSLKTVREAKSEIDELKKRLEALKSGTITEQDLLNEDKIKTSLDTIQEKYRKLSEEKAKFEKMSPNEKNNVDNMTAIANVEKEYKQAYEECKNLGVSQKDLNTYTKDYENILQKISDTSSNGFYSTLERKKNAANETPVSNGDDSKKQNENLERQKVLLEQNAKAARDDLNSRTQSAQQSLEQENKYNQTLSEQQKLLEKNATSARSDLNNRTQNKATQLEQEAKAAKDATKAQQELDAQEAKSKINYGAEEKASLSELVTYINKTVIPAINAKTKAFETEQSTVASVVKAERESLSGLKSDLTTIADQLSATFTNGVGNKPVDTTVLLSSLKELTVDINTKPIVDVSKWQATIQAAMKSQTVEVKASADVTKLTAQEKSANTSKAKDYYEVMKQDLKEIKKLKEQLPNAGSEESVVIKQIIKQLQEQVRYRQEMIKQNNLEIVGEQKKVDLLTKEIEIINAKNKDKRNSASEATKKSQEDNQIKITDESLTSDQWASTLEELNLVEIKLGNIQSIVKSIRSVNGKDLISYKITDTKNDSITVGQNGKLDAGKQSLLDVGSASKTLETNLQALYRAQINIVKGNNVGFNNYLKEQAKAAVDASRALLKVESETKGVQSATDALNKALKLEDGLQKDLDTERTKAGASSSTNTYDPILKSINQLINSEEKYLQLQAKKDVGTATDGELERLRLLTSQRKRDNDVIAQATALTKKQQAALDGYNSTYSKQNKDSISQNFKSVESEKTTEYYKATARLVEIEEKYQLLKAKREVGTANNTDIFKLKEIESEYGELQAVREKYQQTSYQMNQSEINQEQQLSDVVKKGAQAAEEARAVGIGKSGNSLGSGYKDINEAKKALEQYASTLGRISKRTEISPGLNTQMKTLKTTIIDDNNVMQELVATFNYAEGAGNSLSVSFGKSKEVLTGWAKAVNTFETKYKQLFGYMSALYLNPYMLVGNVKSLVSEISEFQNSLTQISYTMDISNDKLTDMGDRAIETGKQLGTSANDMMDILKVYSNMQTTTDEMLKQATPTAILSNLSGEDASTVTDQIQGNNIPSVYRNVCYENAFNCK